MKGVWIDEGRKQRQIFFSGREGKFDRVVDGQADGQGQRAELDGGGSRPGVVAVNGWCRDRVFLRRGGNV
jgi:hypothetical protein